MIVNTHLETVILGVARRSGPGFTLQSFFGLPKKGFSFQSLTRLNEFNFRVGSSFLNDTSVAKRINLLILNLIGRKARSFSEMNLGWSLLRGLAAKSRAAVCHKH